MPYVGQGQLCPTGHRAAGILLGPSGPGVWDILQGLSSVPQMHGVFGAEKNTSPMCFLSSAVSMWTKNYKLIKLPRASSECSIFLCGEEKLWKQLS